MAVYVKPSRSAAFSYGIGVERTFPMHSPRVVMWKHPRGKVRRAKLYYLRNLQGKAAKLKEVKRV